ncbi:SDR family NAD(P)-dependent oxidoreductase [Denitrobaculum tricleocarpae]|uniref:SDR family NAD(P)-dependent oxidoreductase n=1 Tax=Denitrobaculum tricleocarpae TaxID=2591009 RepID=A0A545TKC0_9PROT|nr:SDR family NAD(P)-dependent oxidoreductase [Denitrobaculum tricleocarpae]TQV77680.1 SDR family NAD(P)-dependent oxidoreductase [Denitrobaculum tricleocarpae]
MARRALVTGGNRGIGFAIAAGLAKLDYEVVIAARDVEAGERAAEELGVGSIHMDLSDLSSIEAAAAQLGDVDVLVNNAGVLFDRPMLESPEDYRVSMAVMLDAPYHLIRLLSPGMIGRDYGRIVNLSSDWGAFSQGLEGPGAYGVAKAALNALTLALSRELPDSIKINAMCPGWVRTRMGGDGANRSPEEGADTALWLASLPGDGPSGGFFRDRVPLAW